MVKVTRRSTAGSGLEWVFGVSWLHFCATDGSGATIRAVFHLSKGTTWIGGFSSFANQVMVVFFLNLDCFIIRAGVWKKRFVSQAYSFAGFFVSKGFRSWVALELGCPCLRTLHVL